MEFEQARDPAVVRQAILELAADVSFTLDEKGVITSCSPAFEGQFGCGTGEVIGTHVDDLLPGLRHMLPRDGRVVESVVNGRRRDGVRFTLSVRMKRIETSGHPAIVAIAWHVGPYDETLHDTEEMLRAVADASPAVIYIKDSEGRYVFVNRRYEELFHARNDFLRGKTDHDLLPKETADALRANDLAVANRRVPTEFDETVPSGGEPRQYISLKFPLMRASGDVYAVCGISTDITERKRAEERLRYTLTQLQTLVVDRTFDLTEAHQRLRKESARSGDLIRDLGNLIATANEGIWTLDINGRTTFVNARMARMLGYSIEDMLGRSFYDFMSDHARRDAERLLARRMEGHEEQHDFEFRHKNGSSVWAIVSTGPIRDPEDRVVGALGMLTDITARKRAETEQTKLLQELDHRVKNNLATVSALAELTIANVGTLEEFRDAFGLRIQALARTHEALARAHWSSVTMNELVGLVLEAHVGATPGHIVACGEPVRVVPRVAAPLALTLNELGANALKHGALSGRDGTIRIDWKRVGNDGLEITWVESHPHHASEPCPAGTGSLLMRGLVQYELNGTLDIRHDANGLDCRIVIPVAVPDTAPDLASDMGEST